MNFESAGAILLTFHMKDHFFGSQDDKYLIQMLISVRMIVQLRICWIVFQNLTQKYPKNGNIALYYIYPNFLELMKCTTEDGIVGGEVHIY